MMSETLTRTVTRKTHKSTQLPSYVFHSSFESKKANQLYDCKSLLENPTDFSDRYMPDDITKDYSRRMHFAAHMMHSAKSVRELKQWTEAYHRLRDLIVIGNRKLIFRAVRRRSNLPSLADDFIGDCHIVMIQAVAVFNPWLGIRFSTYAYTCLVRALGRLSQKHVYDWATRSISLESISDRFAQSLASHEHIKQAPQIRIDEFLRDDHPLLTKREKAIITKRYNLGDEVGDNTLERVGESMGLSKERVRQVQAAALNKLRHALTRDHS